MASSCDAIQMARAKSLRGRWATPMAWLYPPTNAHCSWSRAIPNRSTASQFLPMADSARPNFLLKGLDASRMAWPLMLKAIFMCAVMLLMRFGRSIRAARKPYWRTIAGAFCSVDPRILRSGAMTLTRYLSPIWAASRLHGRSSEFEASRWPIQTAPALTPHGRESSSGSEQVFSPARANYTKVMPRLANKVAIVTGAAHGIGRSIAELFAAEGAWVLVADVDSEAGELVANGIKQAGGQGQFLRTDVTSNDDVERTTQAAADRSGRIDILVNNAAHLGDWLDVQQATPEQWSHSYAVNLGGAAAF